MEEKRFIELMEANNEKLYKVMDEKIEANNEKISVMIDGKIKENNKILDKRFDQLEKKIIDNNFYFEEKYGKKIDAMFEKIMMDDQKNDKKFDEYENYMALNNKRLLSHEVRITNLEKAVNSK